MTARLAHRGPDGAGAWCSQDQTVHLGHTRLAVIDPSPAGSQPMVDEPSGLAIVYNGEIYNFRELRSTLEAQGERFSTGTDTEVLLAGYRRWGEQVLDRLVGMFAFALVDLRNRIAFLARDRAGEKPLYWAMLPNLRGIAFSSELAALREVEGLGQEIDLDSVALYLQYQYVPAPRSIWKRIHKLPPAHCLKVHLDAGSGTECTPRRYWTPFEPLTRPELQVTDEQAEDLVEQALRRSVSGQLISDVPLGAFLSGGIDSTAVVAMMRELASGPVRTFTIRFEDPVFNEADHALAVARHLGAEHTEQTLTSDDALALVPKLTRMYSEPFADASALPTHLVSCVAREQVTVSLSGDGGDELFGGYPRYDLLQKAVWPARLLRPVSPLLEALGRRASGRPGRALRLLALPPKEIYRHMVQVFDRQAVALLCRPPAALEPFDRAWTDGQLRQVCTRRKAMMADLLTYLPGSVLTKVDRAAMATSLETRAPLLDHRLMELALRLPRRAIIGKRVLRRIVYRRVPRRLVDRPKAGFEIPLSCWMRGSLGARLEACLESRSLAAAGIEDPAPIKALLSAHRSGLADHARELWTVLVLADWLEQSMPSRPSC